MPRHFSKKTGKSQAQLQAAGVTSKEKTETEPEPEPVQTKSVVEKEPTQESPVLDAEKLVKEIVGKVGEEYDIDGLNAFVANAQEAMEKVEMLEDVVKELSGTRDEQLAEMIQPPAARFAWSRENKSSSSDENLLKEDEPEDKALMKAGPDASDWLSNLTKTAPVVE